jgi:hypothetical protein
LFVVRQGSPELAEGLTTNGKKENEFKMTTVRPEPFDFAQESLVEGCCQIVEKYSLTDFPLRGPSHLQLFAEENRP